MSQPREHEPSGSSSAGGFQRESRLEAPRLTIRRRVEILRTNGPLPEIPKPIASGIITPRGILAGEVDEVKEIDDRVHSEETVGTRPPSRISRIFHAVREFVPHALDEFFWNVAVYPSRGGFWPKINAFYDHPQTHYQKERLKWALGYSLVDQLPKGRFASNPIVKGLVNVLDKNRLAWQAPLWGISLLLPIGPILSLPTNITNTVVAFAHKEWKKGFAYGVFTVLDIAPFALALAAIPILHLSLIGLGIVGIINILSTFLPTQTMLNERYQSAYTEANVRGVLQIVKKEKIDPVKKRAHMDAIGEFMERGAKKSKRSVEVFRQEVMDNITRDIDRIDDPTDGKIVEQRNEIQQVDHKKERLKREHYSGRYKIVGWTIYQIGKRVKTIQLEVQKLLAERRMVGFEEERKNLIEVREILTI